ncbi:MAG TPA: hypothetical protein VIV66_09395 [Pyrinomonadaceae bacterium]
MVFALAVRQCAYIDPDLWWHLQTGHDIVATHSIPHVDIYSFTKAGSEWVTHEWLAEVFMYGVYRIAGWGGLLSLFSALITLALFITYRRCDGQPYVAAFAVLLAAASSSPLFGIRPQMLTFLFASIYIALISRFAEDGQNRRLWWMVPMMLVWANVHAGYAVGLGLIGLYVISFVLNRSWELAKRLGIILLASAAVVPLNPNGFRMFSYPLETLTSPSMAAYIEEWASPDFHKVMFLPLAALLFILLGALALSPKRARAGELFLLFATGFGALRSGRHIPIFALIAAPVLAKHVWASMESRGWERWFTKPEVAATGATLLLNSIFLIAPATLGAVRVYHFVAHQKAYESINYPLRAVDFLDAHKLPGPIYNNYGWGGYLINRLYPNYRVYIDGRADVYGDDFMTETMRTFDGHSGWRQPLDRLSVHTVLISPDAALASLLRNDVNWQRVYEDDQAVIFTRSTNVPGVSTLSKNSDADQSASAKISSFPPR